VSVGGINPGAGGTKTAFNPHTAGSAANASGFLLVSLSKTPWLGVHVFAPVLVRRGVSDQGCAQCQLTRLLTPDAEIPHSSVFPEHIPVSTIL
jgi:hypothetical protein